MSACIYCIDNDIIKKLATFQLFNQTLELFNSNYNQVNILETAQYKFGKDFSNFKAGKSRKKIEDKIIDYPTILSLAQNLAKVSQDHIDLEILEIFRVLSSVENIDQGEAILISHAIGIIQKNKPAQIFTGDKRFIKALAKVDLPIIQSTLNHQLWCLEQLILKNIEVYGFESIRDFIVPVRACDQAINAIFGSGDQSTPDNSLCTLNTYIRELRNETGSLLNPYPESVSVQEPTKARES